MTGPKVNPMALTPQMLGSRLAEMSDMGIPLRTADWVLLVQSGRWINRLVYNASNQRPREYEIVASNLRVQWELGKWLEGRLIRLSRAFREVAYH